MALRLALWVIVALIFFLQIGESACDGAVEKHLIGKSPHSRTIAKHSKGRSARNGTPAKHPKIRGHKSWNLPMIRIEDYEKRRNPGLNKSDTQRWEEMVKRSRARLAYLNNRLNQTVGTKSWDDRMDQGEGTFLVDIQMGTPQQTTTFLVDTGSIFTWMQCDPCDPCIDNAPHPPYPLNTQTSHYDWVDCDDHMCLELGIGRDCVTGELCEFKIQFYDGGEVRGRMSEDKINYDNNGVEESVLIHLGMGFNVFESSKDYDGILGLGRSDLGLSYQLASQFGTHVFSHCFVNPSTDLTSKFKMGDYPDDLEGIAYTPMVAGDAHYKVNLLAMEVGGQDLHIPPSVLGQGGGAVVDSGTAVTYIPRVAFNAVTAALRNQVGGLRVIARPPLYSFCFDTSRTRTQPSIPTITFTFEDGVELNVEEADAFEGLDGNTKFCLAMEPLDNTYEFSVIGNVFMQNQWVVYDNKDNEIGFVGWNCDAVD